MIIIVICSSFGAKCVRLVIRFCLFLVDWCECEHGVQNRQGGVRLYRTTMRCIQRTTQSSILVYIPVKSNISFAFCMFHCTIRAHKLFHFNESTTMVLLVQFSKCIYRMCDDPLFGICAHCSRSARRQTLLLRANAKNCLNGNTYRNRTHTHTHTYVRRFALTNRSN